MPDTLQLYFMALIPGKELSDRIRAIQQEIGLKYKSKKSLIRPVHITLLPPFSGEKIFEERMNSVLPEFFGQYSSFTVTVNGFGSFPPQVLFIKPEDNPELQLLHRNLMFFLRTELNFTEAQTSLEFTPHITVAYRDLTKEMFYKAWKEFQSKDFTGSFTADTACLLRHDGKLWEVISEFKMR